MKGRSLGVPVGAAVAVVAVGYGISTYWWSAEPVSGKVVVNVLVPVLDGAGKAGEIAFDEKCAVCHGKNAAGQEGVAPPLIHKIYEPGHHGDMAFVMAAKNGVRQHHWPFGDMPPVAGITDDELALIINYVRTVQRANGIE